MLAGSGWRANVVTSTAFVAAWGYFLVAGVIDPHGGIRALWPLFGLANQLLAGSALVIATTILIRTGRARFAWVTGLPLGFLLAVTMTAGTQYVFHPNPRIGFLSRAQALESGVIPTEAATRAIQVVNARLDAGSALLFLVLVATVVASAVREWWLTYRGERAIEPDPPPVFRGGAGPGRSPLGDPSGCPIRMRCC